MRDPADEDAAAAGRPDTAAAGHEAVERLERELRRGLERLGATEETIASVMGAGCRLDGVGAAGLEPELAEAGQRLRERVRALAAALDRAAAGRYGVCEGCGGTIDEARLELIPATTRCRRCAT